MGEIEAQLERLAEHLAAQEPAFSMSTQNQVLAPQGVTRRHGAVTLVAIAACLVVALVVGVALLLATGNDPSSVQTPAGAPGGCAGKAYVVDGGDGDGTGAVFAITMATGEVSTPIPVKFSTSGGAFSAVAITPDGKHAYVTHGDHDTVLVIDTATGAVSATIPVGKGPFDVAITPDGKHVYTTTGDTVSVIDTATGAVSATIPVGTGAAGVAITPDGKYAYVTGNRVSVIDTATGVVSASIDIGGLGVAITPDGRHAYVAGNSGSSDMYTPVVDLAHIYGMVSVIDTASGVVSASIPVGSNPQGMAITPDGTHAYVADYPPGGGGVSVIDTASGVVSATVPVGSSPQMVTITPDGRYAYVTGPDEYSHLPGKEDPAPDPLPIHGTVSVIDTATGVVSATIPAGKNPGGVAICPS